MNDFPPFAGSVKPPADMIDAARRSFADPANFERLMAELGTDPSGKQIAPTPDQLCAAVEQERAERAASA